MPLGTLNRRLMTPRSRELSVDGLGFALSEHWKPVSPPGCRAAVRPARRVVAMPYDVTMRRAMRATLASASIAVIAPLSGGGCSCADLDCLGSSVVVDIGSDPSAAAVRICIDGVCEVVPRSVAESSVALPLSGGQVTVRDNADFELMVSVLDQGGSVIASSTETRKLDVDECRCTPNFTYRWAESKIQRA